MKKIICILSVIAMILSLCACSGETTTETTAPIEAEGLQVGYAVNDITPMESIPLASYGDQMNRFSTGYLYEQSARATAIKDANGNTLILITADSSWGYHETDIVNQIHSKTGIPKENIIHCGTHTHSAISPGSKTVPAVNRYNTFYINMVVATALAALEDFAPAKVYTGTAATESMNFVRHYYREDGTVAGDNFGQYNSDGTKNESKRVSHVSDSDPDLQVIKFDREGKKDVVLANFQTHPHMHGKTKNASAENWGPFRDAVEEALGVHCMAFNGAAGNINSNTSIASEKRTSDFLEWGKFLAQYVIDMYDSMKEVKGTAVKATRVTVVGEVNHTEDALIADANKVVAYFNQTQNASASAQLAATLGMHSYYHAAAIVRKAGMEKTMEFEIGAYSIGDVAFISMPYEMFDTNGVYIKTNSPFEMTFLCGYWGNQSIAYIPSELGYQTGCYEADNGNFAPGTGEKMADEYVKILKDMYTTKDVMEGEFTSKYTPAEKVTPPTGVKQMDVYWNLNRFAFIKTETGDPDYTGLTTRTKASDGYYHVAFAHNGEMVTLKVKPDLKLINNIDNLDVMGLVFDSNGIVTGYKTVAEMGGTIVAENCYVEKIDGMKWNVDSSLELNGREQVLNLSANTIVLDVTDLDPNGAIEGTTVSVCEQVYTLDRIVAIKNGLGEVTHVFVRQLSEAHQAALTPKVHYCDHCKEEVVWMAWTKNNALPQNQSGHFYLTKDVKLSEQDAIAVNQTIILDLNGKTVRGDSIRRVVSLHNENVYFALMDYSAEQTGKIVATGTEMHQGDCVWVRYGTFEMFGGTLDASGCYAVRSGTAVSIADTGVAFNMYGGTIIGGTNTRVAGESGGFGGSVFIGGGKMTMYGGTIQDGKAESAIIDDVAIAGMGGNIYVHAKGAFEMIGGVITGGQADNGQGDVHVADGATFIHTGGTIG